MLGLPHFCGKVFTSILHIFCIILRLVWAWLYQTEGWSQIKFSGVQSTLFGFLLASTQCCDSFYRVFFILPVTNSTIRKSTCNSHFDIYFYCFHSYKGVELLSTAFFWHWNYIQRFCFLRQMVWHKFVTNSIIQKGTCIQSFWYILGLFSLI